MSDEKTRVFSDCVHSKSMRGSGSGQPISGQNPVLAQDVPVCLPCKAVLGAKPSK